MVIDRPQGAYHPARAPVEFRFGLLEWRPDGEHERLLAQTLTLAGHTVLPFAWNAPLPADVDVVLAFGPFGSLAPLCQQLARLPLSSRPRLVWWPSEQLPNPAWPAWLVRRLGAWRSFLERQGYGRGPNGYWHPRRGFGWVLRRATRVRYVGDLDWLHQNGLLSVVVVGSGLVAAALRAQGLDPLHTSFGVSREWWADLSLARDIPVVWLGNPATARRRRHLAQLRSDLRVLGIEMLMVDGREHPYMFGQERTVLLNRTQIIVNFVREPWDNNGLRHYLASANGALVVSEPTLPHHPFVPGVHLVEAPPARMAEVIAYYLSHPAERAAIVAAGQRLARIEHIPERSVARLLHRLDPTAAGARP